MKYQVQGLDKIYTNKKEAFRQAKNISAAAQAPIMVYEIEQNICADCGGKCDKILAGMKEALC